MDNYPTEEVQRLDVLEPGAPAPRRSLFRWLRIPVLAAAVLVIVFGAWWYLTRQSPEKEVRETHETAAKLARTPPPFGQVYLIKDLVLNPTNPRQHFMVSVGLEYFDPEKEVEIRRREPLLRDNLITFFSSQPAEVLTNIRYRQAIRSRVKKIMDYQLGDGVISRVFFEKWVFQ